MWAPRSFQDPFDRLNIHDELSYWFHKLARGIRHAPVRWKNTFLFAGSVLFSLIVTLWLGQYLAQEAALMAGIFVIAALLWVTEALPLFATALLVIGLEVLLLANPGGWNGLGFEQGATPPYRTFLSPLADPIIVLFLGGFLMAQAAIKEGVDKSLASLILKLFGGQPHRVMLGLMLVTALFSMWMSNTATTAMMITLVVPMLSQLPKGDRMRKGLLLSIPFAANIGGMGTPIASPPNAVAVAFLQQAGYSISFGSWMLVAVPLMLGLLLFTWLLLGAFFRTSNETFALQPIHASIAGQGWFVIAVFLVTIGLWLSEPWHGLPTAVVALLPAIAFTATGLIRRRDFNSLEWHILILIAGGIALGMGMQQTGLDTAVVEMLPLSHTTMLITMVGATMVFSTFMSNTAAANLLLPLGVSFALTLNAGEGTVLQLAISIALAASAAMILPISTPPNAIAYAHGELETRDLAWAGGVVGVLTLLLVVLLGGPVIGFWLS